MKNLLLILCLLTCLSTYSQVSYTFTYQQQAGNPGGLNQEADFSASGWTILQLGGLTNNQWSSPVNLPFPFELFGQSFSQFRVSANGLLTFGSGNGDLSADNASLPTSLIPDHTIACFWESFTLNPPTSTNDFLQMKIFGTAPNRQCWIRWYSYEWGPASFAYFSVVLEEQGGVFHLVDHYSSINANLLSSTVGVQQNSGFAVQAGSNISLPSSGSDAIDNSYYTFTPYLIPPEDIQPVGFVGLEEEACGTESIPLQLRVTNQGQQAADTLEIGYALDGVVQASETVITNLGPGDSATIPFNQLLTLPDIGEYTLTAWASGVQDDNLSNDSLEAEISRSLLVDAFPYEEDFENGPAGWGVSGSNASWELGTPSLQGAASGTQAWATDLNGTYSPFERSFLAGPCMDFSGLPSDSWISFWLWWEAELNWDGLSLQASTDHGQSWNTLGYVGDGWYNSSFIGSLPGDEQTGWTGQSNGWKQLSLQLPSNLVGQGNVLLRFAFAANGSTQMQGFAIDRILIGTPPTVDLGADRFVCDGDALFVDASNALISWSNGSNADSLLIQHTGSGPIIDSLITVTLTNSLGLSRTDSIYLSVAAPINAQAAQVIPVRCQGEANGEIQLAIEGGTGPFSVVWSNGSTGLNPDDFPAGAYTALLSDANGCSGSLDTVSIGQPAILTLAENLTNLSCADDSSGAISLSASGGNGGYNWLWNTGDTVANLSNLDAGTYEVSLQDSRGCEIQATFNLTAPDALVASADVFQASCVLSTNGSISLSLDGGTPPYDVQWAHGDTGQQVTELGIGSYTATVQDANGCELQTASFEISSQDSLPEAGFSWTVSLNELSLTDSSSGAETHAWNFGDGTISSEVSPLHIYADIGLYEVQQIVLNACGTDTLSEFIRIDSLGIVDTTQTDTSGTDTTTSTSLFTAAGLDIQVFPNPSNGQLTVVIPLQKGPQRAYLQLFDFKGIEVYAQDLGMISQRTRIQIPRNVSPGQYYLRIQMRDQTYGIPLVLRY